MRGYVTVSTTTSTICTAFLLWRYKPQVIKVRGELAHGLLQIGRSVGATMWRTKQVILEESNLQDLLPAADKVRALRHQVQPALTKYSQLAAPRQKGNARDSFVHKHDGCVLRCTNTAAACLARCAHYDPVHAA